MDFHKCIVLFKINSQINPLKQIQRTSQLYLPRISYHLGKDAKVFLNHLGNINSKVNEVSQ